MAVRRSAGPQQNSVASWVNHRAEVGPLFIFQVFCWSNTFCCQNLMFTFAPVPLHGVAESNLRLFVSSMAPLILFPSVLMQF